MAPVLGYPCTNHKVRARIYGDEPHATPHFHLIGADWEASICIETGDLLAGDAPATELREARRVLQAQPRSPA